MILSLKKYKFILISVLLILIIGFVIFLNPQVRSHYTFFFKNKRADQILSEQKKNLEKFFAEPWPHYDSKKNKDLKDWPKDLEALRQFFTQPVVFEVTLEGGNKALLLTEGTRKARSCPPFPDRLNREFPLHFKKLQSSLIHYEYVNSNQKVLIETRRRAFFCEIEILIKDRQPATNKISKFFDSK